MAVFLAGETLACAGASSGQLFSLSAPSKVVHGEPLVVTATMLNADNPYDTYSFFSYFVIEKKRPYLVLNAPSWISAGKWSASGGAISGVQEVQVTIPPEELPSSPGKYSLEAHGLIVMTREVWAFGKPGEGQTAVWEASSSPRSISFAMVGDFTPPTLTLAWPATDKVVVTNSEVTMRGTAGLENENVVVEYRIGEGDYIQAEKSGSHWSATFVLAPGPSRIEVRATDAAGNRTKRTRTIDYYVTGPISVSVVGEGRITPFTDGQVLAFGRDYVATAIPAKGYVFSHWGLSDFPTAVRPFTMAEGTLLQANFVPDPYPAIAGSYRALFSSEYDSSFTKAGVLSVTVRTNGSYAATLQYGTNRFTAQSQFDASLNSLVSFDTAGFNFWLHLGSGPQSLQGRAEGPGISDAGVNGFRYRERNGTYTGGGFAGRYTAAFAPQASEGAPMGNSFATLAVSSAGIATISTWSADGQNGVQTQPVAANGDLPWYLPLYSGAGGWVGRLNLAGIDPYAHFMLWSRPAGLKGIAYREGFTNLLHAALSTYTPPPQGMPVMAQPEFVAVLTGGNLPEELSIPVSLNIAGAFVPTAEPVHGFKLLVNRNTGTLAGSFLHPALGRTVSLKGVILQEQRTAYGYFSGTNCSGSLVLEPGVVQLRAGDYDLGGCIRDPF